MSVVTVIGVSQGDAATRQACSQFENLVFTGGQHFANFGLPLYCWYAGRGAGQADGSFPVAGGGCRLLLFAIN